jgi:gamma-glutamyltranspeptidase/glutathione hydrolase
MPVQITHGRKAAVVAGHPLASAVALDMLRAGGNTVDAAVAGAAVLAVVLPHACSLGGDCFALVHDDGRLYGMNGSGLSPAGLPANARGEQLARGPLSCSTPGVVGAWEAMHRRFGTMPWADVLGPAITMARDGVPASSEFAAGSRDYLTELRADPGCSELFLKDGEPWRSGEVLRQPALAQTLENIAANGADEFYHGWIAGHLCDTVAELGGALAPEDLAAYAPLWVDPLHYEYRGHKVCVMPPNSYGLAMLLQLAALQGTRLQDQQLGSVERLRLLIKAAEAAFRVARPLLADPGVVASRLADALGPSMIADLRAALDREPAGVADAPRGLGTAVLSVADGDRNGVTIVQSIFAPFGSCVADRTTGIVLNNRLLGFSQVPGHPNRAAPGKRPAHTLNPVMVFEGGKLRFLLGTPGGSGQTITLTQVLTNMLDLGLDLKDAIAAARWSMDLQGNFTLEHDMDPDLPARLAVVGVAARMATKTQRYFFGSAECIAIDASGGLTAAADFRREAAAAAG